MSVRALVIDDSVVARRTVANVLAEDGDVEVVATASDGHLGLRRIAELHPDVVTLDMEMPVMPGLETLEHIRRDYPELPVIMYSTLTERGATATLEALALGAVDYATKPAGAANREEAADQVRRNLLPLVRQWGKRRTVQPRRLRTGAVPTTAIPAAAVPTTAVPTTAAPATRTRTKPVRLVVIGISTGGPDALAAMMPTLPADLAVPVVIVQHMPPVFTAMLAKRLNQLSPLTVTEAVDGELAEPGHAYLAPGGRHLEVRGGRPGFRLKLTDGEPENSCRPAADVLLRSAVAATGGEMLGVIMTGMGQDGLLGIRAARAAGAAVLAQDEESSVVWGMPGFVAKENLADAVLPLEQLGSAIARVVNGGRAPGKT